MNAAATISSGLLVAMFSIFTMAMCALYFGPDMTKTSGLANAIICLTGMQALSFRSLVQNGITETVPLNASSSLQDAADFVQAALTAVCLRNDLPSDCWQDEIPPITDGGLAIILPDAAGDFAGQTAYLSVGEDGVTIDIEGGLWLVAGFWTWSGLENGLAIYRNLFIALSWSFACILVGIVLPPFRTARKSVSNAVIPWLLSEVASTVTVADYTSKRSKLVHLMGTIQGGGIAMLTTFEPRVFTAPFEYIAPELKRLVVAAEKVTMTCLVVVMWSEDTDPGEVSETSQPPAEQLKAAFSVLALCAKALATNNPADEEALQKSEPSPGICIGGMTHHHCTSYIAECKEATLAWLQVYNRPKKHTSKEVFQNLAKNYLPWVLVPMIAFKRMISLPLVVARVHNWNWRSIVWSLELTLGFVAIFAATVYWDKYSSFSIQTNQGTAGAVWSGWQLLGYAYGFKPTYEGTLKKGAQRLFGTVFGGFMGWLGIIVASWSYDDDAEINPYGLVVWLSVSCIVVTYFTIDPGPTALMGASYDHGYAGMYFAMTEVLVALEVYTGSGNKNPIALNRIVATASGVIMAAVVAATPPYVQGGDPKHALAAWTSMKDSFVDLLKTVRDNPEQMNDKEYEDSFLKDATMKRTNAMTFVKDAARFKVLPFGRVDEKLEPLIEDMLMVEYFLRGLFHLAQEIVGENQAGALLDTKDLATIISRYDDAVSATKQEGAPAMDGSISSDPNISLFLSMAHNTDKGLQRIKAGLGGIKSTHRTRTVEQQAKNALANERL